MPRFSNVDVWTGNRRLRANLEVALRENTWVIMVEGEAKRSTYEQTWVHFFKPVQDSGGPKKSKGLRKVLLSRDLHPFECNFSILL